MKAKAKLVITIVAISISSLVFLKPHKNDIQNQRLEIISFTQSVQSNIPATSPSAAAISESKIDLTNGQKMEQFSFPEGKFIFRKFLDEDGSYYEYYKTPEGDRITRIYTNSILGSEKWETTTGITYYKSWAEGRLFAFTIENATENITTFYRHNLTAAKQIIEKGGSEICRLFSKDSEAPMTFKGRCIGDTYAEYDDLKNH